MRCDAISFPARPTAAAEICCLMVIFRIDASAASAEKRHFEKRPSNGVNGRLQPRFEGASKATIALRGEEFRHASRPLTR